jgi:YfiH family protein
MVQVPVKSSVFVLGFNGNGLVPGTDHGILVHMVSHSSTFANWLVPDWPAPAGVRALCSTRVGGFSAPPYDSLNLGSHVGDDPELVARNRAILQSTLAAKPVFLNQVHGIRTLSIDRTTPHDQPADAAWTRMRGVACTVMVADCLPILLCNRSGSMVAAAHAGWRGLAGVGGVGVLEEVYKHFMTESPVECAQAAIEIIAFLGPCIGPEAFEVGGEVVAAFTGPNPEAQACFKPRSNGKWLADMPALARQRLLAMGISQVFGNDGSLPWCTVANPLRFFSHRRDGISGRQAACIWLE